MKVRTFLIPLAVAAAFAWSGSTVSAADVTAPLAPVLSAAPVSVGMPGCETCQGSAGGDCALCKHGAVRSKCDVCGKLLGSNLHKHKHKNDPFPVTLCPGACFGYFQTQWRKWDEVCPYPYTGIGVSDAARPSGGYANPLPPGSGLAPPRPLDGKVMPEPKKVDLPAIPPAPGNKFGP